MNAFQAGMELFYGDYTAYTPDGVSRFRRAGAWSTRPERGDLVYFYSTSMGRVSHVGLVTEADLSGTKWTIKTIEGNTSVGTTYSRDGGHVAKKSYTFSAVGGESRINGFGRPAYGEDTCTAEEMIAEAERWIGYQEKTTASLNNIAVLSNLHADPGTDNVTLFGHWYAESHGEVYKTGQWCAMFIAFCGYKACAAHHESAWSFSDSRWHYRKADGQLARNEWIYDGGRWYVFDGNGDMVTGWFLQGFDDWYYLADDGGMCASQWIHSGGIWYYVTASGLMAKDAYVYSPPQGYCYVDEDGVWDGMYLVTLPGPGAEIAE